MYVFIVLDYCIVWSYYNKSQLKVFAFLLPMEYVFEDFIYGFTKKEMKDINAKAQTEKIKHTTEGHLL